MDDETTTAAAEAPTAADPCLVCAGTTDTDDARYLWRSTTSASGIGFVCGDACAARLDAVRTGPTRELSTRAVLAAAAAYRREVAA